MSSWSSGRVVDYNPYIYTLPAADTPPSQRPEPGPGSSYDEQAATASPTPTGSAR